MRIGAIRENWIYVSGIYATGNKKLTTEMEKYPITIKFESILILLINENNSAPWNLPIH